MCRQPPFGGIAFKSCPGRVCLDPNPPSNHGFIFFFPTRHQTCFLFYSAFALLGVFTFGEATPGDLLTGYYAVRFEEGRWMAGLV